MGFNPSNDFNALSWLSPEQLTPAMREKLLAMALNGDSIVNPLGAAFDNDERTPQGRARKDREEQEKHLHEIVMAQLEERRVEFQHDLDRREQACIEALRENDEQLREARAELQKIRDSAYEISMPDGTMAKVYRDGDKVRMENGTEVSRDVVKAEDLGDQRPSLSSVREHAKQVDDLLERRSAIVDYHRKVEKTRDASVDPEEFDQLRRGLNEARPLGFAAREAEVQPSTPTLDSAAASRNMQKLSEHFAAADRNRQTTDAQPVLSDADFDAIRKPPSVSLPSAR